MSGEDKSNIYKTLNDCTSALTEEMAIGQTNIYVTLERHRYNELLKAIAEAKKLLARPANTMGDW